MVIITIPAYDEEQALPPLLEAMARLREASLPDMRLIVVDDGSRDSTAQVVRDQAKTWPWISLVQHERNMGLSQAIQTGFQAALKDAKPGDVIVTLDADNTQPPDTIPTMLALLSAGHDVVVASRFRPGAKVYGVPPLRQLFSWVLSILFQATLYVKGIRDYSCGFRAYRSEALVRAYETYGDQFITERGFACMVEILLQLNRLGGLKFAEVPFILHYDLKPTATKMRVGRTITDTLRLAIRHRFARRPPAP
jgi:dolichol-phosphate mannosyltransferase